MISIARNSTKRRYRKSTKGCLTCKTRRVKCDEVRPICGNCRKYFVRVDRCEYPQSGHRSYGETRAIKIAPKYTIRQTILKELDTAASGASNSRIHILERRLIHHYAQSTCIQNLDKSALPICAKFVWQVAIPQFAFSSQVVRNAMIAISGLHLFSLTPEDQSLLFASRVYLDRAIAHHRSSIDNIDRQNSELIVVTGMLIAHYTWLVDCLFQPGEPFTLGLRTYYICKGTRSLLEKTDPMLQGNFFEPLPKFQYHDPPPSAGKVFLKSALEDMAAIKKCFNKSNKSLAILQVYELAANEVVAIYHLVAYITVNDVPIEQEIVTILHKMPPIFIDLLKQLDPIAMALLARCFVLLSLFKNSIAWWFQGTGEFRAGTRSVEGIQKLMPDEWLWIMEWPRKVAKGEINLELV
ncbi:hypothetical protein F5884DRAFT_798873 [Xylogone sp. PMI_703]|nr:hypothetical protein F5884DRAFT_798873 [Xylogone sp. PMI_703]